MMPVKKGELIIKWVGILTNIHEQKMLSEILEKKVDERTIELIQSNKDLENLNNELRQFAWIASHDLQEPLRKIHVFSSVLKDKFLAGNETAQHHINKVIQSSARLMQLVNDLLTYTALSVQTLYKPVELDKILSDVLIDLELLIREKNALIHVGQLPCVDMIPVHATQLFQNILSNALK
jgi:light-regulated signal transduction histidine kinase (bacteriophytochrome)